MGCEQFYFPFSGWPSEGLGDGFVEMLETLQGSCVALPGAAGEGGCEQQSLLLENSANNSLVTLVGTGSDHGARGLKS